MNINDEYVLLKNKCLGTGSFSSVYLGCRIKDNMDVAIKKIKISKYKDNPRILSSINDEISIMKKIKLEPHVNIINCYDIIKKEDKIYIIMEYCENGDLSSLLKKPIKEKYVQFYFAQIASGLKYLFSKGIIHRDIKPKNILLTNRRKKIKIADFGFAKHNEENELLNTICGSPLYMSPEIITGMKYNSQSDLWSVGMILFEMLYGYHPYNHCRSTSDLYNTVKKDYIKIPPDNINTDVSKECLSLLKMLLQKNVDKRITWNDFLSHKWINRYEYIIDTELKDTTNDKIISVSLGSIIQEKSKEVADDEFSEIDDYEDDSFCIIGWKNNKSRKKNNVEISGRYCK